VLFEDSPLAIYLKQVAPEKQLRLEPTPSRAAPLRRLVGGGEPATVAPSARHNECYAALLGSEEAHLERDFPDVRDGLRSPVLAGRPWWTIGLLAAVAFVATLVAPIRWALGATLGFGFITPHVWWRGPRTHDEHIAAVKRVFNELGAFADCVKLSLNVVREVELVSRGYRVGAVLSPVSRLEKAGEGEQRKLEIVRRCAAESLESARASALELLRSLSASCSRDVHPAVAVDLEALSSGLGLWTCRDSSLQSLSEGYARLCHFTMRVLIMELRLGALRGDGAAPLIGPLAEFGRVCTVCTARLSDVTSASGDWRLPSREADLPAPLLSGGLTAALRTLGARLKLLEAPSEATALVVEAIGRDVVVLNEEWESLRERLLGQHQSSPSALATEQPTPFRSAVPEHSLERLGCLEVEVIGDGSAATSAPEPRSSEAREAALEQVLQMYLSEEDTSTRRPTESREQRIEAMRVRKTAEEAALSETRAVYSLMSELQQVLDHRRRAK
jgi:hypothetical protein